MSSRWPWLVAVFVIAAFVWLWRSASQPEESPKIDDVPVVTKREPRAPSITPAPVTKPRVYPTPRATAFDATTRHTVDPCTAPIDPEIPAGFEQITQAGITVAWDASEVTGPFDAPLRPVALAHAVAGVLEEAAELTGTDRRPSLTVIVDASPEDLQSRTKTPPWVHGLYDGGAIHLYAKAHADLGVVMQTLRHEVMHAQMHATVGCTPFWFNEGMANYFAGVVPTREWFAMLRSGDAFDLATVHDPAVLDLVKENAQRMYAVSLAMVVYLAHRGGEQNLRAAMRVAQDGDEHRDAVELWDRIAPNVDYRAVIDSLAQRVFATPLGPELELVLRGAICCRRISSPAELSCRVAAQGELGTSKGYFCRARW